MLSKYSPIVILTHTMIAHGARTLTTGTYNLFAPLVYLQAASIYLKLRPLIFIEWGLDKGLAKGTCGIST